MKYLFVFSLYIIVLSCSSSTSEDIDGIQTDTIQQSVKDMVCDYQDQIISVSTKGDSWVISNVFVNGKVIPITKQENLPYSISQDWFTITRTAKKGFTLNLTKNNTLDLREIEIVLSDRNFYSYTVVIQKPK